MKKIAGKWILTIVSVLGIGFSVTEAHAQTVVPFTLKGGHLIVVEGSIGTLGNLNLIIDTGASVTVVSESVAKTLKLKGRAKRVVAFDQEIEVEEVTLPIISIAGVRFEPESARIGSLSFPDTAFLQIDALIGLDLLRKTGLAIDFTTRSLTFGPVVHSGTRVGFYNKFPFLPIAVMVGGRTVTLLLDTGSREFLLFARSIEGRVRRRETGETSEMRSAGGRRRLKKVFLTDVQLGTSQWGEMPAYILESAAPMRQLDGVLGVASLGLKRLVLDFENGLMSWEK
jgi:predicted aspartyl protease